VYSVECHLLSRWFLAQLIFSTFKMEAICSSETSVDTQRITRRYIPEDGTLQFVTYCLLMEKRSFGLPTECI
jgi:hypothetical protein